MNSGGENTQITSIIHLPGFRTAQSRAANAQLNKACPVCKSPLATRQFSEDCFFFLFFVLFKVYSYRTLEVNRGHIFHPSFLHRMCPPSLLPIHCRSKLSTHPPSLCCCHGNHHCVANGEGQKKIQVSICLLAVAEAAAWCPANLLKQLPVWDHLSFLSESKLMILLMKHFY